MSKKLPLIIIVLVVVVVIGVGAWMFFGKGEVSLPASGPGVVEKKAGEEAEEFVGKIKDVVDLGTAMKCTYLQGDFTGESYIKGRKMYGEVSQQGKKGYIIIKDNCMWNWSPGESQGVKMCFEEDFWDMPEESGREGQVSVPIEAEYRCVPAVFSDAKFNPPADVSFMDLDELMKGSTQE